MIQTTEHLFEMTMKTMHLLLVGWWLSLPSPGLAADIKGTVTGPTKALAEAVVCINKIEGKVFPAPKAPVVMDQVNLTFVPHVLPVLVGTRVNFPNSDVTMHNVFSPSKDNRFDLGTYQVGTNKMVVCDKAGVVPILCHIHHEMSAFIVIVETPYFAVTDPRGAFTITNVPPGRYQLTAWQERMKPQVQAVEVPGTGDVTVSFILPK